MNKKPKILVVGSFVMDQIASTSVIPNEGETVLGNSFRKAPGGKGANQAVQVSRLGADVTMVGKVGKDANGEEMIRTAQEAGIHTEHVLVDPEDASGCSVIILLEKPGEATNNRIIVISGTNMKITREDVSFLENTIDQYDLVMLQLEIPMEINEYVAALAKKHGVPVMLNSAPWAPLSDEFLANLDYISPNEHEVEGLTGLRVHDENGKIDLAKVREACEQLHAKGVKNVLVTLGGEGAALLADGRFMTSPCVNVGKVVDPTAAGDSFVGAFCYAVGCGADWEEVLRFANYTAGITVTRMGAMPSLPTLDQVHKVLADFKESVKL